MNLGFPLSRNYPIVCLDRGFIIIFFQSLIKMLPGLCLVLSASACSMDDLKRTAYEVGNNYACNEHEPNLPEKVRQCQEREMSYEQYKVAREKTLSDD